MKNTTRTARPTPMSEIAGQWHQALRGDAKARGTLLRRIMPPQKHR